MKKKLLVVCISIVFTLIIAEIAVRTYDAVKGEGFFSEPRNKIANSVKKRLPFRTFGPELYKRKDGRKYISSSHKELYPLKKPEYTYRIVVLGGSTSFNKYTFKRTGQHYPLRLQTMLRDLLNTDNIEVINVSYPAHSTAHSIILLELDVISWDPDLIIVSHNTNDLSASYWPDFALDYSNKYSQKRFFPSDESVYTLSNLVFQHSELYWLLTSKLNKVKRSLERKNKKIIRRSYGNEPPLLALEVFKRNLQTIIDIAEANDIKVVLGNQPIKEPSKEYFEYYIRQKSDNSPMIYPLHGEWVKHHGAFNRAIAEVAAENQVLLSDNDAVMRGKKEYFIDIFHYTPKGVDALAMIYANLLLGEKAIQLSKEN